MWENGRLKYDEFLSELYESLGFENESQEKKDEFALNIMPIVVDKVMNCVLRNLDQEVALSELERIADSNPDHNDIELLFALVDVIPGLEESVVRNLNDLKDELTDRMGMIDFVIEEAKK